MRSTVTLRAGLRHRPCAAAGRGRAVPTAFRASTSSSSPDPSGPASPSGDTHFPDSRLLIIDAAAPGCRRWRLLVPCDRPTTPRTRPDRTPSSLTQLGGGRACWSTARWCSTASPIRRARAPSSSASSAASSRRPSRWSKADRSRSTRVEYSPRVAGSSSAACRLGLPTSVAAPTCSTAPIAAARDADAVVVVVGTNADWETEGRGPRRPGPARVARTSSCAACDRGEPEHGRGREHRRAGDDAVGR